jgi:hypothetical protein
MTTKIAYRIIVIVTIVFFAFALTGCAGDTQEALANATTTTGITVNASPRIGSCSMSSHQILLNEINSQVKANDNQPLPISTDAWLDGQMERFACIAE